MNWWNVIFEGLSSWKASITKPTFERCGLQTYFCLKKYHSKFSFEWPLSFMNMNVWLNGTFNREVCVTDFTCDFFHVFSTLGFQKTSITYITAQWFFFHELKKCDIWRIVLLKSKHHKTNIWKAFSPYEQMQCGLKKYHCKFHIWMTSFFHEQECVT